MGICPECKQGKCINCGGMAWDDSVDDVGQCSCYVSGHGGDPRPESSSTPTIDRGSTGSSIERIDKYNLQLGGSMGVVVVAGPVTEDRIRGLSPDELERFKQVMGGRA